MDSMIYEEFHEFDGGWRNNAKEEYTWDANGKEILMMRSGWMVEQIQWFTYQKTEYFYNVDGKLSVVSTQMRDTPEIEWRNEIKTEYSYQGSMRATAIMNLWDQELNVWIERIKYEYTFDGGGKIAGVLVFGNFDTPTNWQNSEKYEYSYNGDDDMEQELLLWWDEETSDWTNHEKYNYYYEGKGNLISENWSDWNLTTLEWQLESKLEFTHDDSGNISGYMEYWWGPDIEDWEVDEKCDYSYNNSFTYNDLLVPFSFFGYFYYFEQIIFKHMLLTEEVFEAWDADWDEDTRTTYFYSEFNSSSVNENGDSDFVIYPNPTNDFFTINLNNSSKTVLVEIFDARGKMVISQELIENQPISVVHLNRGVYVYKFVFNDKAFSGKLLVQ
jgi:hypothetical protein